VLMVKLHVQLSTRGQSVDITLYCRLYLSFVSTVLLMQVLITSHLQSHRLQSCASNEHVADRLQTMRVPGKSNRPGHACNVSIEHEQLCRETNEKVNGREHSQCKHTVVRVRKKLSKPEEEKDVQSCVFINATGCMHRCVTTACPVCVCNCV